MSEVGRYYQIHLKEIGGERVIEWTGQANTDKEARRKAMAAADDTFEDGATITGMQMHLGNPPVKGTSIKHPAPPANKEEPEPEEKETNTHPFAGCRAYLPCKSILSL